MRNLRNTSRLGECIGAHVAPSASIWGHVGNTRDQPGPLHIMDSLTHINCYMGDVITAVQGRADRQREVFDGMVRALKWLFPSLPGETKGSVSVKKLMADKGNWIYEKEVSRWRIYTEAGTVSLSEQKHLELLRLLAIPAMQRRMDGKELERLVGKLLSV